MSRNKVVRPPAAEIIDPTPPAPPRGDPVEEVADYVNRKWFQQLCAVRTNCYRCGSDSPIIHAPLGVLAFDNPAVLRRGDVDVTEAVVVAFASIGWKFQKRKSYCPVCKGLGVI